MRKIWDFVRRDARHAFANVISLVVIVGLVVVPSFYAWFNIAGSWDPYGNTKNLQVAVANTDEGYESELMPVSLNLGERVVSDLSQSESIGYVTTSEDEAVEGVRSGRYYAAIVISPSFSRDMMTILSPEPVHPKVSIYQNEKENAIATIVTDKASSAVEKDIDASFAESVTTVGAGVLDELGQYLDDDQMMRLGQAIDEAIAGAQDTLGRTADDVRSFSALVGSTQALLGDDGAPLSATLGDALDAGGMLRETADGVEGVGDALDGAATSISDAIDCGGASLDGVSGAIDQAFETAGGQVDALRGALGGARELLAPQISMLEDLSARLDGQDSLTKTFEDHFELGSLEYTKVHEVRVTVQGLAQLVDGVLGQLRDLDTQLQKTADDLATGATDAEGARQRLQGLVDGARQGIEGLRSDYDQNVRGALGGLAGQVRDAAAQADDVQQSLVTTLDSLDATTQAAADDLGGAVSGLDGAAATLDGARDRLGELHAQLHAALASEDLQQVRTILSSDPDELAAFVSAPVSVDRTPVFPVENNGSAMAPFYTTLAIWIGGVVLCALVKATPSPEALRETGCSHAQAYLGRIVLFVAVGFLQAALIFGGDLFYLGVQCAHPWLFLLACLLSSLVYVNIIYALTASFGDVGKAIAVVLMVVQVAGSGGTFPREMLPQAFQALYPFLPFVHSENAMRAAMFGLWGNDFWVEVGLLAAFLVPSLLLGLILRRPVIKVNEWFDRKLEETKLM